MSAAAMPLRVLLWSPSGAGLHYSGPAMAAHRLYAAAGPERWDVTLVHGRPDHAASPRFRESIFLAESRLGLLPQWRFTRAGVRWMRSHASQYDVVHGIQGFHATVAPCMEAQRQGIPAVIKLAAQGIELTSKSGLHGLLGVAGRRRRLVRGLSGVIAISRAIEEELLAIGVAPERIAAIPNGVDARRFRPARDAEERRTLRAARGWPERATILFVGAVGRRKRPHLLIEALASLVARGIDVQVALVGPVQEPDYAAAMRGRAEVLRVADRLIWEGFTEDPAPLYRAADLFALPSSNEGLPNALLEAQASGLPSVGTRISGITDLIEPEATGSLTGVEGTEIAEGLIPWLADPEAARRAGALARARIERGYGLEAVADAHERLFRAVIAGRDAAGASLPR